MARLSRPWLLLSILTVPPHRRGHARSVPRGTVVIKHVEPGTTERVQALADISRSALCCHTNETRAPIARLQIRPIVHN